MGAVDLPARLELLLYYLLEDVVALDHFLDDGHHVVLVLQELVHPVGVVLLQGLFTLITLLVPHYINI